MPTDLTLIHHWVEGLSPVAIWVVHHDVDHDRHEPAEDRCAVTHLIAIDGAVPGCAAVD